MNVGFTVAGRNYRTAAIGQGGCSAAIRRGLGDIVPINCVRRPPMLRQ